MELDALGQHRVSLNISQESWGKCQRRVTQPFIAFFLTYAGPLLVSFSPARHTPLLTLPLIVDSPRTSVPLLLHHPIKALRWILMSTAHGFG